MFILTTVCSLFLYLSSASVTSVTDVFVMMHARVMAGEFGGC